MKFLPLTPDRLTAAVVARFIAKTSADPYGCLLWTAYKQANGYGVFAVNRELHKAHRVAWVLANQQSIPENAVIDHLCRVRSCVNPQHLEAVTQRENLLRGNTTTARNASVVACPQGHPYTPENTLNYPRRRVCRTCNRIRCQQKVTLETPEAGAA